MHRLLRVAATLLGTLSLVACQQGSVVVQESFVFGTRVEVTVAGLPEGEARAGAALVLAEFDRLHRMLHAWQPSEVTALNEAIAAGRARPVSPELGAILRDAQALTLAGERLFDPGIGRLVALWGFHGDEFRPALPEPTALAAWRAARPSLADLRFDGDIVRSVNPQVAVDLGGYAKGYALDRAAAILRHAGIANALVNIGGNVMALGDKNGKPWRVGIRDPRGTGFIAALDLADGEAIGTSGDYQRFFEVDGQRYAHLLDPRSGTPAAGTRALTVLVGSGPQAGTRSDVWSKPLFVADEAEFRNLADRLGAAQVLRVDADGRIQVASALAKRLRWSDPPPPFAVY
ncbi:MAG TPA: FAD:protein FMN transferase [Rhodocyclaceae bacterium]